MKIFKYPIIGPYTPLRTPRRTCRYLSGPEILEVRNYLLQYSGVEVPRPHFNAVSSSYSQIIPISPLQSLIEVESLICYSSQHPFPTNWCWIRFLVNLTTCSLSWQAPEQDSSCFRISMSLAGVAVTLWLAVSCSFLSKVGILSWCPTCCVYF